jgi:hypothetical protein
MGFMLFDPDSTIDSVRSNLKFLRKAADISPVPISFAKMLPLAGTPIERRLADEGRLIGTEIRPDYNLLDPRLDGYALFVILNFSFWNSDPFGMVERLRAASTNCRLAQRFRPSPQIDEQRKALDGLIVRANDVALATLGELLDFIGTLPVTKESVALAWPSLTRIADRVHRAEVEILDELNSLLARHSPDLHRAFSDQDRKRTTGNHLVC